MDFGSLATIGRNSAVAEFGRLRLTGFPAWLFWCVVHVYFLIGFRNRIMVILDWFWSYVTLERGAQLVTESVGRTDLVQTIAPSAREFAAAAE